MDSNYYVTVYRINKSMVNLIWTKVLEKKSKIVSCVRPVPSIHRLLFESEENIIKTFVKERGQDSPTVGVEVYNHDKLTASG